jgi:4-hydroxyphenylpyruvate dioxygenase
MNFEYLHLFVKNPAKWRDWFVKKLDFWPISNAAVRYFGECAVRHERILILLSSPSSDWPAVASFLQTHSEGVGDVAFRVRSVEAIAHHIQRQGGQLLQPVQTLSTATDSIKWCRLQGWGSIVHTVIESTAAGQSPLAPNPSSSGDLPSLEGLPWLSMDHAVLNVPTGDLVPAARWYEQLLGFTAQQRFVIETPRSGLRSIVLKHLHGNATMPINEPTSPNSQIQEFLDAHQGAGIQHVALKTRNLIQTIAHLRQRGLSFLSVPDSYYQQLSSRLGFWQDAQDWSAIADQQILVDWPVDEPRTRLLQTFTQPLFEQPTFFWEFIERQSLETQAGQKCAEGFGEGNFQALFEAIEREQELRGSLD